MTNNNERLIGNRLGLRIEVFSFFGVSLNVKQQQTEKENKGKPFWHRGTQPSWHRGPAAILATSEKSVAKAIPSAGCGTERNGAVSVCVHIALYGVVPIKARPSVLISRLSLRLFVKIIRSLFKSMSSLDGCTAHRNGAPSSRAKKTGFFFNEVPRRCRLWRFCFWGERRLFRRLWRSVPPIDFEIDPAA